MFMRLRALPIPIVTAINGIAAGAGMSLALTGDIRIAARSASFLQAFARIGLVPDCGSSWLLPRLIGMARAMELSLLAERLPAETALSWGLINRLEEDDALMPRALAVANGLAAGPRSLGLIRQMYWQAMENTIATNSIWRRNYRVRLRSLAITMKVWRHFEKSGRLHSPAASPPAFSRSAARFTDPHEDIATCESASSPSHPRPKLDQTLWATSQHCPSS